MKKTYEKPQATIVVMSFDEHIAASGIAGECSFGYVNNEAVYGGACMTPGSGTGKYASSGN